ncbi:putative protein YGL082W [Talaromyces islandicus]|uniref:MINDY deubiquitinase domain-containing protein n=1 Tax=Talaromyces islandicus TaxID=28573 RepID=A0A0U1MBI8_TALIS|nr:putative protein YGL082W [Talaromyces islandicus]
MVLRKQPPPGIEVPPRGTNAADYRSPVSRSSASPRSAGQRSSRKDSWELDTDSIYSPDLHTSPAFDLMPLEQAQKSPMSAHNPWEDELVEKPEGTSPMAGSSQQGIAGQRYTSQNGNSNGLSPEVPAKSTDTTQMQASNELQLQPTTVQAGTGTQWEMVSPQRFRANNPFARPRNPSPNPWEDGKAPSSQAYDSASQAPAMPGIPQEPPERSSQRIIPMTARLSIFDQPEDPWAQPQSQASSQEQTRSQIAQPAVQHGYSNPSENIWQLPPADHIPTTNVDWIADSERSINSNNEWQPMGGSLHPQTALDQGDSTPRNPQGSSPQLIDLDETPTGLDFNAWSGESQSAAPPTDEHKDERKPPALSQVPTTPLPPMSEAELQRFQEKQAETYAIRHVNWTDNRGKLRESPVLVQNKNGPCPLLALVNGLIMRSTDNGSQSPIVRALQTRENISLGLLIQALFDELTTYANEELPDIDALSRFLTMLHTGMNVNPRLTLETPTSAGVFYETSDLRFYDAFRVPLLHGWIAEPTSNAHASMTHVAQYFEDIQLLPFRKEELENRVIQNGSTLTADEQRLITDIDIIQYFVDVENPTQLSSFGLSHLGKILTPGSISILFRNDHFSTLYKHPQSGKLFTLITDAGYADHPEIVWESLVDMTGSDAEFFAGDFRPVGHGPSGSGTAGETHPPTGYRSAGQTAGNSNSDNAARTSSPQANTEQEDADYAYALSLQFQEEARQQEQQQRNRTRSRSIPQNRRSSSTVNTGSTSTRVSAAGHRYTQSSSATNRIRNQSSISVPSTHSNIPMDAPSDHDNDENAPPPSYDQVTRNRAAAAAAAAGRTSWASSQRQPQRQSAGYPSLDPEYARRGHYPGTAAAIGRRQQQHDQLPPVSPAALERGTRGDRNGKDCIVM